MFERATYTNKNSQAFNLCCKEIFLCLIRCLTTFVFYPKKNSHLNSALFVKNCVTLVSQTETIYNNFLFGHISFVQWYCEIM